MKNNYFIIDSHCHIYPEKIVDKAVPATDRFYGISSHCRGTVEDLLARGEKAGFDFFIVQSVATTPKQVRSINTFIANEVAAHPDKLLGLGALHPDSEDQEGDVEYLISLGLKGVKLHPDIQNFDIDDPRCIKIYELCRNRLPILMHTGDNRYDHSNPNRLLPILKQFPDLTVIGAHFGGWSIWEEASKAYCDLPNLLVDCSSSFYCLTKEKAREIILRYGVDKVMFATDYPMWSPEEELEFFLSLGFTREENEKMLSGNARRLFGI